MNAFCPPAGDDRLHVAVVTETYPPDVNGVALSLARLVKGLQDRRHVISLVRPRRHDAEQAVRGAFFEETLTGAWPLPGYPGLRMGTPSAGKLVAAWQRERPDVVHIATEGPLGWSALRAANRLGLPVTSDFRTNFHAYSGHYGAGWLARPMLAYLRYLHNACRLTTVPTPALQGELKNLGFERLRVLGRGVDTALFQPGRRQQALRQHWGAGPDDLVLISVGRLAPEKNLREVVAVYDALQAVLPNVRLVWVGDGPQRAALQARCPHAHFAGDQRGEALAAHYASADLFVFPSLTETYGNVVPEAMASGLPVLAYDLAAAGQLIASGRNGWLAQPGDSVGLQRLALQAAADPIRRRAVGDAAASAVVALGWRGIVQRFEALLHEAIGAVGVGSGAQPAEFSAQVNPQVNLQTSDSRWQPS